MLYVMWNIASSVSMANGKWVVSESLKILHSKCFNTITTFNTGLSYLGNSFLSARYGKSKKLHLLHE